MLVELAISIMVYVFQIILTIINPMFSVLDAVFQFSDDGQVGAQYIFGNLGLFNSIFPVSEAFVIAGVALSIKFGLFGFKVFWAVASFSKKVFSTFVSFRL